MPVPSDHSLLAHDTPSRAALVPLCRSIEAAALELAAATSQCTLIWSQRHDPEATRRSDPPDTVSDVAYRALVRERLVMAIHDYLCAGRDLLQEASRGAFLSDSEPVAARHPDTLRAYIVLREFDQEVPF